MQKAPTQTIGEYVKSYLKDTQEILQKIRSLVKEIAPNAGEKISYGIPTMTLNGTFLVYFATYKNHISIYPIPPLTKDLKAILAPNIKGKGTIQFPLNQPIPYDIIKKVINLSLIVNLEKTKK